MENSKRTVPSADGSGQRQMKALLDALEQGMIFTGQGKGAKKVVNSNVVKFLQKKLEDARVKRAKNSTVSSTFEYLKSHSICSSRNDVARAIEKANRKHLPCIVTGFHHQMKIASGLVEVSSSDQSAGKVRGLVQVQSYNLAIILDRPECTFEHVCGFIASRTGRGYEVGAHLCKQKCIQKGHTISADTVKNTRNHETCPAYWVVEGSLVNMCHCGDIQCIAPGPYFNAKLFKAALEEYDKAMVFTGKM